MKSTDFSIEEKIKIIKELDDNGLAAVTRKYKISYATAVKWKEEIAAFA